MSAPKPEPWFGWDELIRRHADEGGHFFDPASMRFFHSRRIDRPRWSKDGRVAVFVTSEAFEMDGRQPYGRWYTVRVLHWESGDMSREPWGFQAFSSSRTAVRWALKYLEAYNAAEIDMSVDDGRGALHVWTAETFPERDTATA